MARSPISAAIKEAGHGPDPDPWPATPVPGGPDHHVVVTFTAPSKPLSVNATNGRHYATSHTDKLLWRRAACAAFVDAAEALAPFRGHRVELTFCLPLVQWRRADGANYASGISAKAAVDGVVASLVLVPDDRSEWVKVDCVFWDGGPSKDEVRVRVRVADAPWDGSPGTAGGATA